MITLPRGRAFTRDDLQAMPDDGRRYELVDGALVVTPAPGNRHQTAVLELAMLLRAACPSYWVVDPEHPSVTVWELQGRRYVERAHATGAEELVVGQPYSLRLTAALLTD